MGSLPSYTYEPLDRETDSVRMLHFVPAPPDDDRIYCELEPYPISQCPPYIALSYTWGPNNPSHEIVLHGALFLVRENLWLVLQRLQNLGTDIPVGTPMLRQKMCDCFWIDAICINQEDDLERSYQVNRMGKIFSTTRFAVVWLGKEDNIFNTAVERPKNPSTEPQVWREALGALSSRSYWRRMWIIQEFILPKNLLILCGSRGLWWSQFRAVATAYQQISSDPGTVVSGIKMVADLCQHRKNFHDLTGRHYPKGYIQL